MLNGIDPILIFHFWQITDAELESLSKIPIVSSIVNRIGLPPIPIYLSEKLTGLYITDEEKSIDIETTADTLTNGDDPIVTQKLLNSVVRVNLTARSNSIGLILLSACADLIVPMVTSKEYSISYLHGAVTVFNGLLHSFSVSANRDNDLLDVTLELTKSTTKTKPVPVKPKAPALPGAPSLENGWSSGIPPTAPIPSTPLRGPTPTTGGTSPPIPLPG